MAGESGRGPIVGMLTLVVFRIPTGIRASIEDVVVDRAAAGGERGRPSPGPLSSLPASSAHKRWTSRRGHRREAANRLYQKVGFEARETNVYRYRSA